MKTPEQVRQRLIIVGLLCGAAGAAALGLAGADFVWRTTALPPPAARWLRATATAVSVVLPPPTLPALADSPAVTIAPAPYRHPSGAFSILYPDGWQIDDSEDAALFTAPEGFAQFIVTFASMDTGALASAGGLDSLAEAELRAAWGDLSGFSFDGPRPAPRPATWAAGFSFDHRSPPEAEQFRIVGLAISEPLGGVLFSHTYLARAELLAHFSGAFRAIAESLSADPHAATADSE